MSTLIYRSECASTNEEILSFLPSTESDLLALYTFNQSKGKGQYGNSWKSEENLNLALSVAVPETLLTTPIHLLNFHTATSVADFIAIMTNADVQVKWPNDLIIKNKKIGGLLLERKKIAEQSLIIIGIGLNILQQNFEKLPKAGSLFTQTGLQFDLHDFTASLNESLAKNLTGSISNKEILTRLNKHLYKKEEIAVFNLKSVRQNGIIKKVDEEGFLWIDLEKDGLQKFWHKEIELLY